MEQAVADLDFTLKDFLGFSVIGALIAMIGSFIALYLKDVILARSFERWKEDRSLSAIFDKYRKPLGIASLELSGRCYDIAKDKSRWNLEKTSLSLISQETERPFSSYSGPYYYKYKLISNAYRLCCFLCWLQRYRDDLGLLNTSGETDSAALDILIDEFRKDLGDGQLNRIKAQKDFVIFREEQKAIAYKMMSDRSAPIDFGVFCEKLYAERDVAPANRWLTMSVKFFSEIEREKDFRCVRMKRLVVHLTDIKLLLQPNSLHKNYIETRNVYKKQLEL